MKLYHNKIIVLLLFSLALSPLIYYKESVFSIIMGLASLVMISKLKWYNLKLTSKNIPFILTAAILILNFTVFYSTHSLKQIGNTLFVFIIPLLSPMVTQLDDFKKNRDKIMLAYCISICILCVYFLFFFIKEIPYHHFNWYLSRYTLEFNCQIHGTYICLWIGVAILFLINHMILSDIKNLYHKTLCVVLLLILIGGLIVWNSRNIMLGLFIIGFVNLIMHRHIVPKKIKIAFFLIVFLVIIFSQRYFIGIKDLFNDSIVNSPRYVITSCVTRLIYESHFMGMDYNLIQTKLNECYVPYKNGEIMMLGHRSKYNSHNQYLDYFLKGGFVLFFSFMVIILFKIKNAIIQKNYLYLSITLLFSISFITENVLVRQYGIFIYMFCDVLLLGSIFANKNHTCNKVEKS